MEFYEYDILIKLKDEIKGNITTEGRYVQFCKNHTFELIFVVEIKSQEIWIHF